MGDLFLPRDVWSIVLAKAAAPLRELPQDDGLSHVVRWLDLALVCKQWHDVMLSLPVGLRLFDGSLLKPMNYRGDPVRISHRQVVAAVRGLASSRVPICRLEIPTMDPAFEDSDVDGERHLKTELSLFMSDLFESPKFRAVSGPHLAAVKYLTGFVFSAPPEAFPQLRHLAYVYTRLAHGLPPALERLGLTGDLHVVYGTGFVGGSEVGLRADEAIPHIAAQRRLQHLRLSGCRVSRALLAALPPSLTLLRLHKCHVVADGADYPPQLVCTEHDVDHAGVCHATFELAADVAADNSETASRDASWLLLPRTCRDRA